MISLFAVTPADYHMAVHLKISKLRETGLIFALIAVFAVLPAGAAQAESADQDASAKQAEIERLKARLADAEAENLELRKRLGVLVPSKAGTLPDIPPADIDIFTGAAIQVTLGRRWMVAQLELDMAKEGRIDPKLAENSTVVDGKAVFRNTTAKSDAIRRGTTRLREVESDPFERPIGGDYALAQGWIGLFNPIEITQVIDGQNALCAARTYGGDRTDVWVEMPTAGLVDGDQIRGAAAVDLTFIIVGRKQYETALGTQRTLWHARAFDYARYVDWLKSAGFDPTDRTTWPSGVLDALSP